VGNVPLAVAYDRREDAALLARLLHFHTVHFLRLIVVLRPRVLVEFFELLGLSPVDDVSPLGHPGEGDRLPLERLDDVGDHGFE